MLETEQSLLWVSYPCCYTVAVLHSLCMTFIHYIFPIIIWKECHQQFYIWNICIWNIVWVLCYVDVYRLLEQNTPYEITWIKHIFHLVKYIMEDQVRIKLTIFSIGIIWRNYNQNRLLYVWKLQDKNWTMSHQSWKVLHGVASSLFLELEKWGEDGVIRNIPRGFWSIGP